MDMVMDEDGDSVPSLLEYMPPGVLVEIFKFLDWNDLCQLSRTCSMFREVCQSATLWLKLKSLDFTSCAIPSPEKILAILGRTPNAEHVILGDVILEGERLMDHDWEDEEREDQENEQNVVGADRFVLNVLKTCPQLSRIELYMHEITDRTVEAVCAKCTGLQSLSIHDNQHINKAAIQDLVSNSSSLTHLCLDRCEGVTFPSIQHTDAGRSLGLTRVSLTGLMLVSENVQTLVVACQNLQYLDLSGAVHLDRFTVSPPQGQKSGLDTLEELVLRHCEYLRQVTLPYGPRLRTVDVTYCERLVEVTATCPQLTLLELDGCSAVQKVDLSVSSISHMSCREMESLNSLHIGSDQLHTIDLPYCSRMSSEKVLEAVTSKSLLTSLDLCGCKGVPPDDVNTKLLTQFPNLEQLKYGGHAWASASLASDKLRRLVYSECVNTTCVLLNMPALEVLRLHKCRDFTEQDLLDSLLHGRQIRRMQGLDSLIDSNCKDPPFSNNTGVPNLLHLQLHDLPGLHGDILSHWMKYFQHLVSLELVHCTFLAVFHAEDWPCIREMKLESCCHLGHITMCNLPALQSLEVKWCGMVADMTLRCDSLDKLNMTGTNFAHLDIQCDLLTHLHLYGVITQSSHSLNLRCCRLEELKITKCDRLTDNVLSNIVAQCPALQSLTVIGSLTLRSLVLPSSLSECSLTRHHLLREIILESPVSVKHLTLNNLAKFVPERREELLQQCESSLTTLEVRAIPGEKHLSIHLAHLNSLTLDQGIHLATLEIKCPLLRFLRIQGCPRLHTLSLHLSQLSQLQVYHSTPLLALRNLSLHCPRITHLATVLACYCPKLVELTIVGGELRLDQLYSLGRHLLQLNTVTLMGCSLLDDNSAACHSIKQQLTVTVPGREDLVVKIVE